MLLKEFLESYKEKHNLSVKQLSKFKQICNSGAVEEIIEMATQYDFLPIIKYFIENGGDPHFVIESSNEKRNILNVAAEENSLEVIKYLLDNNIFTADQRADENAITAFHSAIENENFGAAELLLRKGADINAEYFWRNSSCSILQSIFIGNCGIKLVKFLVKHGINISHNLEQICPYNLAQKYSSKSAIKDFLLSIKKLDNLFNDFDNAYKSLIPEIQEIWDIRVFHLAPEYSCTKILGTIDHHAI